MAGLVDFSHTMNRNGKAGLQDVASKQQQIFKANSDIKAADKALKKSNKTMGLTSGLTLGASLAAAGSSSIAMGALAGGGIGLGVALLANEYL